MKTESRLFSYVKGHRKYFVLFGVYLLCFALSMHFDPFEQYRVPVNFFNGDVHIVEKELYTGGEDFFDAHFGHTGVFVQMAGALLTFGITDVINIFSFPENSSINETVMVVFPAVIALKYFIMKRFFSRKQDSLERSRKDIFCLISGNLLCEAAADNAAFYIAGLLIRLFHAVTIAAGSLPGGMKDIILGILLIFCFIPYFICKSLFTAFIELTADIGAIETILASGLMVLLFELAMKITLKPLSVIFEIIGKNKKIHSKRKTEKRKLKN